MIQKIINKKINSKETSNSNLNNNKTNISTFDKLLLLKISAVNILTKCLDVFSYTLIPDSNVNTGIDEKLKFWLKLNSKFRFQPFLKKNLNKIYLYKFNV